MKHGSTESPNGQLIPQCERNLAYPRTFFPHGHNQAFCHSSPLLFVFPFRSWPTYPFSTPLTHTKQQQTFFDDLEEGRILRRWKDGASRRPALPSSLRLHSLFKKNEGKGAKRCCKEREVSWLENSLERTG